MATVIVPRARSQARAPALNPELMRAEAREQIRAVGLPDSVITFSRLLRALEVLT